MRIRSRIEAGFTAWGRFVVRRRWLVIAACLAFSALLVSRLPELRVDNSDEAFLHEDDPARIVYDRFKEQFDREDRIQVVLHPRAVFDLDFLEQLRTLHREIEREVPYVEEVTSLINARNTRGEGDELIVEDFLEAWPRDAQALATLRERALSNPLYVNALITGNAEYTIVSIKPFTYSTLGADGDELSGFADTSMQAGHDGDPLYLTDVEGFALVERLKQVVADHAIPGAETYIAGGPTFDYRLTQALQRDVSVFMTLSLLVEGLLLFVIFRRVLAVVLPLLVVVSAMLSTLGFMVWLDIPFSVTLNMLPAFLLVVGLCDSVHILTIFYRRRSEGRSQQQAIVDALGHSGLAVVMTSVTTASGLLSFSLAELAPIAQLGILAPAGVMLAMLYSLALLPALLAVGPVQSPAAAGDALRRRFDRMLMRLGELSTGHPMGVVAATVAILLLALPGLLHVHFSHDGLRWFPDDEPLKIAAKLIDREFGGASSLEVVIETGHENGLYEPVTLDRIERAMRYSEGLRVAGHPVSQAVSIVDVVKEIHQALNENRSVFYALPDDRELIAQELLLFENSGSDDLEDVTDTRFEKARLSVRTPWVDAMLYPVFLDQVEAGFQEIFDGTLHFELTGGAALFTRVFEAVIYSMARSYVFALAVITPTMILLIGSLRRGLVAMIPNLIPIYLVLALMGWTDIPLDAGTLLIGGVIIGLAVDDTIHFMHKFGRYYEDLGDPRSAVRETLATTGAALLFTSLVLSCGFAVFLAAYMQNTFWFGALALCGTLVAFAADILLAPALMVLVTSPAAPREPKA